jgi:putative transposase
MFKAGLIRASQCSRSPLWGALRWKAKYGGMTVSDARNLKELETENSRLKNLLAEAELDKAGLKDLLSRKW